MKSPFKVMSTAALAAAVAVPTLSVPAADAAESTSFQSVALETEDGSIVTVSFSAYAQAKTFGTGELGEFVESADVVAVSAEEGKFVTIRTLAMAKIENPDADTVSLLDELDEEEDNLVADEDVADYTAWEDMGEDAETAVESVSALNLKQVEVNFNNDNFDAEEVTNTDNFMIVDGDGNVVSESADVSVDGSNAVVTLSTAVDNQTDYYVWVDSDVTGEEYKEEVNFFDTTIPETVGAEVIGNDTIKVKFSEPIASGSKSNFDLDGGEYFVKDVKWVNNNTEANVSFYSSLDEGTRELTVSNGLEDYAGYNVVKSTLEVEVTEDTEAPELVEAKNVTPLSATLVFSEDVEPGDGGAEFDASDFYHTNTSNTPTNVSWDGGNEITLTFDEDHALPNGTAYIYAQADAVRDLWNNKNAQQLRAQADVEVDSEAPALESVKVTNQNTLTVTFGEVLESDSAENHDNYTLLNADGDEEGVITRDGSISSDSKSVTFTLNGDVYGDLTLVVDGVEDLSGNEVSDKLEFNADDTTAPAFPDNTDVTLYNDGGNVETLVINYGEPMATSGQYSVLDLSKYQIDQGGANPVSLDKVNGVKVSALDNNSKVKIDVDTTADTPNLDIGTGDTLDIARVADAAGNPTDAFSATGITINDGATDNVGTRYQTATGNQTVQVQLDDIVTDFNKNDFVLYEGSQANKVTLSRVTLDNSGSYSVINFEIAQEDALNDNAQLNTNDIYVATANQLASSDADYVASADITTSNRFGETVSFDNKVTDSINPELVYDQVNDEYEVSATSEVDGSDRDGDGNTTEDLGKVTLTLTESLDAGTLSNVSFNVDGYTVVDSELGSSANGTDDQVVLYVEESTATTVTPEAGTTITQKAAIADDSGNEVTDISTEVYEVVTPSVNNAPTVENAISNQSTTVENGDVTVDASNTFADADSDSLTLSASSNDTNVANVTANGTDIVVSPIAKGTATITVTANDGNGGTVTETFDITVNNSAPTVSNTISNQSGTAGGSVVTVDASNTFADADSDSLTLTATSGSSNVATATVNGTDVEVTPVAAGTATITVTADDGTATQSTTFDVAVSAEDISSALSAPNLSMSGTTSGAISSTYSLQTGETWNVTSDNTAVLTVDSANALNVTAQSAGTANVTVQVLDSNSNVIKEGTVSVTVGQ